MKRFHVTTFGCQMNEHDSERMKGMLESLGYSEVPEREDADLILFNTCSIREKADERFVSHLLRGAGAQAARSGARDRRRRLLGAVGQGPGVPRVPVRRRRLRARPGAQARRVPDQRLADRPGLLRVRGLHRPPAAQARARPPRLGADLRRLQHEVLVLHRAVDARARGLAAVRGARGRGARCWRPKACARSRCSARTSTPTARGCGRSRASSPSCCTRSTRSTGIERIRYTSPHPAHMTEDVIRAHAELESVCQHIHLPLQAGSSRVLKRMRRTYDRERFLDRVALIREHVPDCALTTDIIVGFPGETEADFAETLEVVEEVGFDGAFTFIYSPRRDTEAAEFVDEFVPHEVAGRAHGAARRGRPAPRPRARPAVRRADARRARRGRLAPRPVPPARPHDAQQGRQLRRPRRRRARSSRSRSSRPRRRR